MASVFCFTEVQQVVAQSCVAPIPGIVSWWPGDGHADDLADGNDGTLLGDTTFGSGLIGQAFSFDGAEGQVYIPTASNLDITGSISIDAWIYPTLDTFGHIVTKWGGGGVWSNQRAYSFHTLTDRGIRFAISDDAHQLDSDFHSFDSPPNVLTLDAWNHVAAVYDQSTGTRRLYVNGVQVAERTDAPIIMTTSIADVGIGGRMNEPGLVVQPFVGRIDDIAIYNRAIAPAEINAIFVAGGAGKCQVRTVFIDIKPGSYPNSINLKSNGVVPVVILSSTEFDATQINPETVTLAKAKVKQAGNNGKFSCGAQDINSDGLLDMVCHVITAQIVIDIGSSVAVLEAKTFSGLALRGEDSVKVVP
jgi:hypothetical protein